MREGKPHFSSLYSKETTQPHGQVALDASATTIDKPGGHGQTMPTLGIRATPVSGADNLVLHLQNMSFL